MSKGRYSSKGQERHFQPCRVQVLSCTRVLSYTSRTYYRIVKRNVVTGEIVDGAHQVSRAGRGAYYAEWASTKVLPEGCHFLKWSPEKLNKGVALKYAKMLAVRDELPFDLQKDIIQEADMEDGHERRCILCTEGIGRGHEAGVCRPCRSAWEIGQLQKEKDQPYLVGRHDLIKSPSGLSYSISRHVMKRLVVLAGTTFERDYKEYGDPLKGQIVDSLGRDWEQVVRLSPENWQRIKDILAVLESGLDSAYKCGFRDGAHLLRRLQAGDILQSALDKALDMQKGGEYSE